jgi:hypothetical protein
MIFEAFHIDNKRHRPKIQGSYMDRVMNNDQIIFEEDDIDTPLMGEPLIELSS